MNTDDDYTHEPEHDHLLDHEFALGDGESDDEQDQEGAFLDEYDEDGQDFFED